MVSAAGMGEIWSWPDALGRTGSPQSHRSRGLDLVEGAWKAPIHVSLVGDLLCFPSLFGSFSKSCGDLCADLENSHVCPLQSLPPDLHVWGGCPPLSDRVKNAAFGTVVGISETVTVSAL